MKDLLVLVADADIQATMRGLLTKRHASLEIRSIEFTIIRHIHRDPGCRRQAASTAASYVKDHEFVLVLFDKEGSGDETAIRQDIQNAVEEDLCRAGWNNRSKAIVIEPELEMWVWSDSANVGPVLGWNEGTEALRKWLCERDLWPDGVAKPPDPKLAMTRAMNKKSRGPTALSFKELAEQVSLRKCKDPAFREMCETLRGWFPASLGAS
ncbi:MAG: hypothetical protein OXF56_06140 [Rhodobacteraceae bacterium]|nr:hypothetical protein [Paracoccaceae bacterium]